MSCAEQDFTIQQGKTFSRVVRWETGPLVYKAITAITKAAPVSITSAGHGLVDGWRAAIISAGGMRQINAADWPLSDDDYHKITKVDSNTITINDISSLGYTAYTSGGSLVYFTAVGLSGYTARMKIKDVVGGTVLVTLTTENSGVALDDTLKTITLTISATATAAITWLSGVYDLELVSGSGVVTQLLKGNVVVEQEVTT